MSVQTDKYFEELEEKAEQLDRWINKHNQVRQQVKLKNVQISKLQGKIQLQQKTIIMFKQKSQQLTKNRQQVMRCLNNNNNNNNNNSTNKNNNIQSIVNNTNNLNNKIASFHTSVPTGINISTQHNTLSKRIEQLEQLLKYKDNQIQCLQQVNSSLKKLKIQSLEDQNKILSLQRQNNQLKQMLLNEQNKERSYVNSNNSQNNSIKGSQNNSIMKDSQNNSIIKDSQNNSMTNKRNSRISSRLNTSFRGSTLLNNSNYQQQRQSKNYSSQYNPTAITNPHNFHTLDPSSIPPQPNFNTSYCSIKLYNNTQLTDSIKTNKSMLSNESENNPTLSIIQMLKEKEIHQYYHHLENNKVSIKRYQSVERIIKENQEVEEI